MYVFTKANEKIKVRKYLFFKTIVEISLFFYFLL